MSRRQREFARLFGLASGAGRRRGRRIAATPSAGNEGEQGGTEQGGTEQGGTEQGGRVFDALGLDVARCAHGISASDEGAMNSKVRRALRKVRQREEFAAALETGRWSSSARHMLKGKRGRGLWQELTNPKGLSSAFAAALCARLGLTPDGLAAALQRAAAEPPVKKAAEAEAGPAEPGAGGGGGRVPIQLETPRLMPV